MAHLFYNFKKKREAPKFWENELLGNLFVITLSIYFLTEPGSDLNMFPKKPSKTIDPPGKP
jgi:hypothetical protein